tara:strand:+ start:34439 stop:34717 length:279 start_codon:yes stop_codon:yes gene_type:complete
MEKQLKDKAIEFIKTFEEVFHNDWKYTKEMLGVYVETEEQKTNAKEMGLETIEIISEKGTFLKPNVEDEEEGWGNRAKLLEIYRELKKEIGR